MTNGDPSPAGGATAFRAELPKSYTPRESEPEMTRRWDASQAFHARPAGHGPRGDAEPYAIFIPPPNVTAALHLGHALNNSLQDVLARAHRMMGCNTLWMPGTDHAGIATQTVVEKRLLLQGKRRTDFTREQFVAKVQEWKDEYEATILSQLKAMGASCDFARVRFTMDDPCATAVREAFFRLFRDGLVYRGKRLVNWDPATRTALADDEVEMETVAGHMWYLRYPLEDGSGHVTVATTRPETMLGDTAVAVNPKDPRAAGLRGKTLRLPIVGRVIPIVEDDYVVMPASLGGDPSDPKAAIATGFLKVTPAHDPNDWEIGRRHGLEAINVMGPDGAISAAHGWTDVSEEAGKFVGLSREDARRAIVAWFKGHGLLEAVKDYEHSVGHSYRSHVPIEPWLSDQWYVRVTDDRLAGAALRAMVADQGGTASGSAPGDGELRFFPPRYAKTYRDWHENIRDWCISRQLWWGHRIPVWSKAVAAGDAAAKGTPHGAASDRTVAPHTRWTSHGCAQFTRTNPDGSLETFVCVPPDATLAKRERTVIGPDGRHEQQLDGRELAAALESEGFAQDPDVLDTWFSSALWPLSTLGWPYPERFGGADMEGLLETFNPSDVLCTAREIITLWVSRMVMFNRHFLGGRLPFRDVFIHAMIQDGHGQKMSKSLGNGVDPRDIIHSHGADAMRFTLVQMATDTQDVRLPVDLVDPWSGEAFTPKTIVTAAGHVVAAPLQESTAKPGAKMVSGYGAASGTATPTDETPLARNTSSRFDVGRNFANKVWNATRFALGNLADGTGEAADPATLPLVDRWILARLAASVRSIEGSLANYRFNEVADALYDFLWRDLCDWYLEAIKPTVRGDARQRRVLRTVLDQALRLLHPVCPFVTERLWTSVEETGPGGLPGVPAPASPLLCIAAWPTPDPRLDSAATVAEFARVQALVDAIRTKRGERQVPPKRKIAMFAPPSVLDLAARAGGVVEHLVGLEKIGLPPATPPADGVPLAFEGGEVLLSGLVDAVDAGAERARLEKTIADRERQAAGFHAKLSNPGYLAKAKPELIEETRAKLAEAEADIAAARRLLATLGG
jgi:valyl-tRNA synthetase